MRLFFKLCLSIFAAFVVLLALATIALRLLLPPAKLRGMVLEQVRTHLHREAQVDRIQLWINGLTIERLRLSERPDFSRGTFIFVESARIRWNWWPLWHHQLHLKEIMFDRPQLNLTRLEDGKTYNISDLLPESSRSSATIAPKPAFPTVAMAVVVPAVVSSGGGNWTWRIDEIRLKDGLVHFNDLSPARQSTTLHSIQFRLNRDDYHFDKGLLKIDSFQINSRELDLTGQGVIELATGRMEADVRLRSDQRSVLGAMDVKAHLSGTLKNPKVRIDSLKKKAFKATIQNLLQAPGQAGVDLEKTFRNIFR